MVHLSTSLHSRRRWFYQCPIVKWFSSCARSSCCVDRSTSAQDPARQESNHTFVVAEQVPMQVHLPEAWTRLLTSILSARSRSFSAVRQQRQGLGRTSRKWKAFSMITKCSGGTDSFEQWRFQMDIFPCSRKGVPSLSPVDRNERQGDGRK